MSDIELFQYFCDATRHFVFSSTKEDEEGHNFSHEQRVKSLLGSVRRMAVKKSFQVSGAEALIFCQADWIQQAVIAMFECCQSYDGKRPFDNYVRFMVSRKMEDIQRALLRKNPPTDKERFALYKKIKSAQKDRRKMEELVEVSGYTEGELREILNEGVGARMVTVDENKGDNTAGFQQESHHVLPEHSVEHKELRQILQQCIDRLTEIQQRIFRLHEMEELSLRTIFDQIDYDRSFATFKRWYKKDIYEVVTQCVTSKV